MNPMVDLFGQLGLLDQSIAPIEKIPTLDYLPMWATLLGSCQRLGNIKLAKLAFDYVVQLDEIYELIFSDPTQQHAFRYIWHAWQHKKSTKYFQSSIGKGHCIKGFGINHDGYMVVQCFKCMLKSGLKPDATTFTCNIHCNSGLF